MPCAGIAPVVRRRSAARSANGEGRERSIGVDRSHFARGMRPKAFPLLRFEGMLTEPDTMSVVSKAEDGCIRSDWPPRLLVAVGCPGGVGSRGFQKKRDLRHCALDLALPGTWQYRYCIDSVLGQGGLAMRRSNLLAFRGVFALALATCARSAWTGIMGLAFESNRPIESKSLHCPAGFLTGIRVKYGRTRQEDRDLYDFKLKCGNRWTAWSGLWFKNEVEDKTMECPSKMYVTGIEVKRGRNDFTDRDTYDFKLQCSGVWQSYIGLRSSKEQEVAAAECPSGEGTSGIRVYRGFVEWGDKDLYEYELNCKSIAQNLASIRGLPDLKMLGLPRNVLTWDAEQLGSWLDALGLGELVPNFQAHNVDGGTVRVRPYRLLASSEPPLSPIDPAGMPAGTFTCSRDTLRVCCAGLPPHRGSSARARLRPRRRPPILCGGELSFLSPRGRRYPPLTHTQVGGPGRLERLACSRAVCCARRCSRSSMTTSSTGAQLSASSWPLTRCRRCVSSVCHSTRPRGR